MFGAGTFYILRLMNKAPGGKGDDPTTEGPLRTAGVTPAPFDPNFVAGE